MFDDAKLRNNARSMFIWREGIKGNGQSTNIARRSDDEFALC